MSAAELSALEAHYAFDRRHIGPSEAEISDMLRVVGAAGDNATRIENRVGEPAANPYLYMASQIHAGLDGLLRGLEPPPATDNPYATGHARLPDNLGDALAALRGDEALMNGLGASVVEHFCRIKQSEINRHADAQDKADFERREYFSRY